MTTGNSALPSEIVLRIEHSVQYILEDVLNNRKPSQGDLATIALSPRVAGPITDLCNSLGKSNGKSPQSVFASLIVDNPWMNELRSKPIPPRPGTEDDQKTEQKSQRRIRFVDDEVVENMPAREWLIGGLLPHSGVCMLFGLPETYKSFLAIDWALSVGFGRAWNGRPTRKGSVAYIAGEGYAGLGARSKAWKAYNRQSGKSGVKWYGDSVDLTDPSSVNDLYEALDNDFADNILELIIIDTFSRNSGGAEENSNTDVKKFMHTADLLQKRYKCTVLIIHHCGKNPEKGPRGASAFIGDTETIICVDLFSDAMQGIKISCFKQKDAEKFDPIHLVLHKVLYGESPEESSLVLIKTEVEEDVNPMATVKKSEQIMYDVLQGKELTLTDWVALGMAHGISESSAKKSRKELYETRGLIGYKRDYKLYYVLADSDGSKI
jgi:hypothetical protein